MAVQQDFGRLLVLPALDDYAARLPPDWLGGGRYYLRQAGRIRGALRKAAEEGSLTWQAWSGAPPPEWFGWCKGNRHPPVVRLLKMKYASLSCLLRDPEDDGSTFARLPPESADSLLDLMRTFVKQAGAKAQVAAHGFAMDGVLIEDSREAAAVLTDLLNERLCWGSK